jgi:hypothetical protein
MKNVGLRFTKLSDAIKQMATFYEMKICPLTDIYNPCNHPTHEPFSTQKIIIKSVHCCCGKYFIVDFCILKKSELLINLSVEN